MKQKAQIREEILRKRNALSVQDRIIKSRQITERLFQSEEFRRSQRVLCYISFRSEVMTGLIAQRCYREGKRFFAPRIDGSEMEFFEILPYEEMERNSMGMLEPKAAEETRYKDSVKEDLMVLPGCVFDTGGSRVGYGGGFYDRYLSKGFDGSTLALGYDLQVVQEGSFETEATDQRVEKILTEEREIIVK